MSTKVGNTIETLLGARTIQYGAATVPASIDDNLQVKWHLPGGIATTSEKRAITIAQRMHLLMAGRKKTEEGVI